MTPMTIEGLSHADASKFARAARRVANQHYGKRVPQIIQDKLNAVRKAAKAFEDVADDLSAMLLAEEVPGVDGEWWDVALTFDSNAVGTGIAEA